MSKGSNSNSIDIWSLLESNPALIRKPKTNNETTESNEPLLEEEDQSVTLFLGDSSTGKSTLIQNFLKPNTNVKDPKPTVALEYNFARKKTGSKGNKYIANIWEIGGDSINEPKLLEIPITNASISYSSIVVVVDLTRPSQLLVSTLNWLDIAKNLINRRLKSINNNSIQVPIFLLANKYDIYKNTTSPTDKRFIQQILRFIGLTYNATIISTSNEASMKESVRNILSQIIFRGSIRQACEIGIDKPFYVSVGVDNYENILLGSGDDVGKSKFALTTDDVSLYITSNGLKKDCWARIGEHIKSLYGPPVIPTDESTKEDTNEKADKIEHPEAEIDSMRAQKDFSLERYKQEIERRDNTLAKMNMTPTIDSSNTTASYSKYNNDGDDRSTSNSRKSKK